MFIVDEANSGHLQLPLEERSKYSFRNISLSIPIKDGNEPLVNFDDKLNIELNPFWNTVGDLEGDTYKIYIEKHPDFQLSARQSVLMCLAVATQKLPDNWRLVIKASYRPLSVQKIVFEVFYNTLKSTHPEWSNEQLLRQTRLFVMDPTVVIPPHTTGAAIDVCVFNVTTNHIVDMGCPPNTPDQRSFTHYAGINSIQKRNRMKLLNCMLDAGFANLAHEWWHFSYGDQYWAAFYGQPSALYDIVEE